MRPLFTMLVGLPGSGKSTWATNQGEGQTVVCSSDKIREEMFGSEGYECTPQENEKVFNELHKRIKENLIAKKNVIYDATNIKKSRRISFLKELKNIDCIKHCIWFLTTYEICLEQNKMRSRVVPDDVIRRMYLNFQPPHETEGWDRINVLINADLNKYSCTDLLKGANDFNQENEHHRFSLGRHLLETASYVVERSQCAELEWAAILHDIGKMKTKAYGEDGNSKYHNHHNVSAYDSIFYVLNQLHQCFPSISFENYPMDNFLDISNLIYYHMHPYMSWKTSIKTMERDKKLLGEAMFNKIMLLHEADVAAH